MSIVSVALLLALRVGNLLSGKSLWSDETWSWKVAILPFQDCLKQVVQDVHPPLYYGLLNRIVYLFGDGELVLRSISFLAGLLSTYFIYRLARNLGGKEAGSCALVLAAISPHLMQSSNEVRGYALLGCLSAACLFYLSQFLIYGRERDVVKTIIALALAVYTEHYAWFLVVAVLTTLVYKRYHRYVFLAIMPIIPAACLLVRQAMAGETVLDLAKLAEYRLFWVAVKKLLGIPWHWLAGYQFSMLTVEDLGLLLTNPMFMLTWLGVLCGLTFFVLGSLEMAKTRWHIILLSLVVLGPVLLLAVFYPIRLDARYMSFAYPLFISVVALGMAQLGRVALTLLATPMLAVMAYASIYTVGLTTDPIHKEDYKGLFRLVGQYYNPDTDGLIGLDEARAYYNVPSRFDKDCSRLWVMQYVNMHPQVEMRQLYEKEEEMGRYGYRPVVVYKVKEGDALRVTLYEKETT